MPVPPSKSPEIERTCLDFIRASYCTAIGKPQYSTYNPSRYRPKRTVKIKKNTQKKIKENTKGIYMNNNPPNDGTKMNNEPPKQKDLYYNLMSKTTEWLSNSLKKRHTTRRTTTSHSYSTCIYQVSQAGIRNTIPLRQRLAQSAPVNN